MLVAYAFPYNHNVYDVDESLLGMSNDKQRLVDILCKFVDDIDFYNDEEPVLTKAKITSSILQDGESSVIIGNFIYGIAQVDEL
jgi:hypothetical protein